MKTRLIATLTALTLAATAGTTALADEATVDLAWQQPGYVMDVVYATAPRIRPAVAAVAAPAEVVNADGGVLASEQEGYVMDVVVVRASRSEVLANAREAARQAALSRQELIRSGAFWNVLGAPAR